MFETTPKIVQISFRIDEDSKNEFNAQVKRRGLNAKNVLAGLIRDYYVEQAGERDHLKSGVTAPLKSGVSDLRQNTSAPAVTPDMVPQSELVQNAVKISRSGNAQVLSIATKLVTDLAEYLEPGDPEVDSRIGEIAAPGAKPRRPAPLLRGGKRKGRAGVESRPPARPER